MEGKTVLLRLTPKLYNESQRIVKENGFANVQELLRESLRKTIKDYETEAAIERLRKLKGSIKNIRRSTKEEREKTYREFLKMSRKERLQLLREFGLDKARKA